jgi:hypothetical protein
VDKQSPTSSHPDDPGPVARGQNGTLAAVSHHDGHQELFVVGRDGRLTHRWNDLDQPYGPTAQSLWSRWSPMGEPERVRRVACSNLYPGHLEVFLMTGDGGLVHRWFNGDPGQWSRWLILATPGHVAAVAAVAPRDGYQDLFVADTDGRVFTRHYPDGEHDDWSRWEEFSPATKIKALAAGGLNRERGHREVFAVTRGGRVLHRWNHLDDGSPWSEWAQMSVPGKVAAIAHGSHQPESQDLFIALNDGSVFVRRYTDYDWAEDWSPMPFDQPVVALASSSMGSGHLELFAAGRGGSLHHRWYWPSTGWSAGESFDLAPQAPWLGRTRPAVAAKGR